MTQGARLSALYRGIFRRIHARPRTACQEAFLGFQAFGIRRTGRNARRGFRSRPEFGLQDRPQGPPLPLPPSGMPPDGALSEAG
jgi:hypothetical protein